MNLISEMDKALAKAGLNQTKFAAQLDVSVSTVQSWLRQSRDGNGRLPDGERSKGIELLLGVRDFRKLFPHDWPE